MKKTWLILSCMLSVVAQLRAQVFLTEKKEAAAFALAGSVIVTDENDHWLIQKTAELFQSDINAATGKKIPVVHKIVAGKNMVLIGCIGKSALIDKLVASKKINTVAINGKWEAYHIEQVTNPFPGVASALVIAGSDRRGTAYGVMELSKQAGVSPWYWWADVPVKKSLGLYVAKAKAYEDRPLVKYRGFFINDEAPALSGWTKEKNGGFNHKLYENVFELLLRLKANYLWPAMWGNAFNDDDTLNPILADQYGIVMGTSHHEPMLRAQQEWKKYGTGQWNYQNNDTILRSFWKKGIENMGKHESIVTVGMRGDGDMPMTQGSNISLLEKIVSDQRNIISEVTGKPASETPQLWALYKEVQDYYDKGMRVPDDVTLLLCDDNWGNLRKLPKLSDSLRKGGYGIYYHFDYVGGPRNYKWLNTNPITRTWEQMHLAYEYNVRDIWIVNVGDIKPMEFPISFFLDYAWNPDRIGPTDLQAYTQKWAAFQFGNKYAKDIAEIISKYTKLNGRRKPELLDQNTYELNNFNEAQIVTNDYNYLLGRADRIYTQLPAEYKDAYFELVLHPVKACANLQSMYTALAKNKSYASKRWISANEQADEVKRLYLRDSLISLEYNRLANGKWNHMMDQTHIGYTYWQQPPVNKMPAVEYVAENTALPETHPSPSQNMMGENMVPANVSGNVFFEKEGYVSIEADHYTSALNANGITWQVLPDHGKTGSAITTFPVTAAEQTIDINSPHLDYDIYTYDTGRLKIMAHFSPTLNFHNDEGLKFAISIDEGTPQIITLNKDDNNTKVWESWVANSIIVKTTNHRIRTSGKHVLKYWMISPAVVLQKIVVDLGGAKQSYLGPPETRLTNKTEK